MSGSLKSQDDLPTLSYEDAVARGAKLLQEINKPPQEATSSKWNNFKDLEANDWERTVLRQRDINALGLANFAEEYDIDTTASQNLMINWKHLTHEHGMSNYTQFFNIDSNTIFVKQTRSPRNVSSYEDCPIPDLSHWSDVTYLQWAQLTSTPENLKRIVRCGINNTNTESIMAKVLTGEHGDGNTDVTFAERKTFTEADGDAFKALLGTPNGIGLAFLLAEHKGAEQLGWRRVESITLFFQDRKGDQIEDLWRGQMVFEIGRHPGEEELGLGAETVDEVEPIGDRNAIEESRDAPISCLQVL